MSRAYKNRKKQLKKEEEDFYSMFDLDSKEFWEKANRRMALITEEIAKTGRTGEESFTDEEIRRVMDIVEKRLEEEYNVKE